LALCFEYSFGCDVEKSIACAIIRDICLMKRLSSSVRHLNGNQ